MKRNLLNTFLAIGLTMALLIFIALFSAASAGPGSVTTGEEAGAGVVIAVFLLVIICAPVPTYLAVLLYQFKIKPKFPHNKVYAVLSGIAISLLLYHFFLVLFIAVTESPSALVQKVLFEYTREYAVPNLLATPISICIPLADLLIDKIKRDLRDYNSPVRVHY